MTTLENDELIRTSVSNLIHLSEHQLSIVLKEILTQLEILNRAAQHVAEDSISGIDLLASQLFLLKVLVACLFHHWRCSSRSAESSTTAGAAVEQWDDPPALEDTLAKHALSIMSVYLKLAIAKEDAGLFSGTAQSDAEGRAESRASGPNGTPTGRTTDRTLGLPRDALKSFGGHKAGKEREKDHREDVDGKDADADRLAELWQPSNILLNGGSSLFSVLPSFPPTNSPFRVDKAGSRENGPPEFEREWYGMNPREKTTQVAIELGETDDLPGLIANVYTHAAMVIFFLSSSNWAVVFARIRNRLAYLSTTIEDSPNTAELRLLECSNVQRSRLASIVSELCTTFLHLKRSAQQTVALAFRRAVWVWISYHPLEFAQMSASGRRLEGAPDVLFDQIYNMAESSRKRVVFWPMLTSLLLLCPDIVGRAAIGEGRKGGSVGKKASFLDALRKGMRNSKLGEVSAYCCVDLVRAASTIQRTESGLHLVVPDIEADLRDRIFGPIVSGSAQASKPEDAIIAIDLLHSLYYLDPNRTTKELIAPLLGDEVPVLAKLVLVSACAKVAHGLGRLPWQPTLRPLYPQLAKSLRLSLKDAVYRSRKQASGQAGNGFNASKGKSAFSRGVGRAAVPVEQPAARIELINTILTLWSSEPGLSSYEMDILPSPPPHLPTRSSSPTTSCWRISAATRHLPWRGTWSSAALLPAWRQPLSWRHASLPSRSIWRQLSLWQAALGSTQRRSGSAGKESARLHSRCCTNV